MKKIENFVVILYVAVYLAVLWFYCCLYAVIRIIILLLMVKWLKSTVSDLNFLSI